MVSLIEAIRQEAARRKDADWVAQLGEVISQAVWPFHLGRATVWIDDYEFYNRTRTLKIEIERLPLYPFAYKFDADIMMAAYEPHAYLFESMREPLFKHFRYRPCLPVEDHIILGED